MDLNSDVWRDLVFEGKNQQYGAYYLRKTSTKRHLYALAIITGLTVAVCISFLLFLQPQESTEILLEPVNLYELNMMGNIYLEQQLKPSVEKPAEEIAKSTPPKIVEDDEEIPVPEDKMPVDKTSADSADLTDTASTADSILSKELAKKTQEEPVTYILDGNNKEQDFQSLQTTILRYVYQNVRYPSVAYKQKIKGRVIYSFVINEDGSVSDITLVKGVYIFLDEEVLRVIKSMSPWEAVKKDGKAIKVKCYLPVTFYI